MGNATPILLLGAGRMGGALVRGWLEAGAFAAADLIVRDPAASGEALGAGAVNPTDDVLASAKVVLLSVKPQIWRDAFTAIVPHLASDAIIVSIAAGVRLTDIHAAALGRRVLRSARASLPFLPVTAKRGPPPIACSIRSRRPWTWTMRL